MTTTTNFVWDSVADCVLSELDGTNAVQAVYTNEPQQYGSVLSQRRGTTTSTYHADALGTTRALTDSTQTTTDTYLLDAWGNPITSSGTTVNPFRWVGRYGYYQDASTGLVYVRARMYQPITANWTSQDLVQLFGTRIGISFYPKSLHTGIAAASYSNLIANNVNFSKSDRIPWNKDPKLNLTVGLFKILGKSHLECTNTKPCPCTNAEDGCDFAVELRSQSITKFPFAVVDLELVLHRSPGIPWTIEKGVVTTLRKDDECFGDFGRTGDGSISVVTKNGVSCVFNAKDFTDPGGSPLPNIAPECQIILDGGLGNRPPYSKPPYINHGYRLRFLEELSSFKIKFKIETFCGCGKADDLGRPLNAAQVASTSTLACHRQGFGNMKLFVRVVIAFIGFCRAVPDLFADDLLHLECQLLSSVESDSDDTIRQVSYAFSNATVLADELAWVTTLNSGEFAFSHRTGIPSQRVTVSRKSLMPSGRQDWPLGAIDSVSLSPDGKWILLVEENGRFAIISTSVAPVVTQYWLPALCFPEIASNRVGLEITSWTWLPNGQLALSYADGRVMTLDPSNGISTCVLPSLWHWESKHTNEIPQHTVPDNLRIFFPVAANVLYRTFPGKASEDRILTLSDHYFAVATRKSVEIRAFVDRSLCKELTVNSYCKLPNGTILALETSKDVSYCHAVSLIPDLEIKTWKVVVDGDHSRALRLVNAFVCANGDLMTLFSDESHMYTRLEGDSSVTELKMMGIASTVDSCSPLFFASDRNEFLQLRLIVTHKNVESRLEAIGHLKSE